VCLRPCSISSISPVLATPDNIVSPLHSQAMFYPMLPPLAPGEHTLAFGGTTGTFSVDVRYDALTLDE
jgi:hypothetical protein